MDQVEQDTESDMTDKNQCRLSSQEFELPTIEDIKKEIIKEPCALKRVAPSDSALTDNVGAKRPKQKQAEVESDADDNESLGGAAYESDENMEDIIKHESDEDIKLLLNMDDETLNSPRAIGNIKNDEPCIWERIRQMDIEDLQAYTFKYLTEKESSLYGDQTLGGNFTLVQQKEAARMIQEIYDNSKTFCEDEAVIKAGCQKDIRSIMNSKNVKCSAADVILHTWVYLKITSESCGPNPKQVISQTLAKVEEGFEKMNFLMKNVETNDQENEELHRKILNHKKVVNRILSRAVALADTEQKK